MHWLNSASWTEISWRALEGSRMQCVRRLQCAWARSWLLFPKLSTSLWEGKLEQDLSKSMAVICCWQLGLMVCLLNQGLQMHGRVDRLGRHGRGCRELESTACPPKNKLGRNPAPACLSNRPPVYNHCNRRVLSYLPGFCVGKNDCLKISRFELLLLERWSRCTFSYSSQ